MFNHEETVSLIISMCSNSTNKNASQLTWSFIKNNWSFFYSRYSDSVLFGRLLKVIAFILSFNNNNNNNNLDIY